LIPRNFSDLQSKAASRNTSTDGKFFVASERGQTGWVARASEASGEFLTFPPQSSVCGTFTGLREVLEQKLTLGNEKDGVDGVNLVRVAELEIVLFPSWSICGSKVSEWIADIWNWRSVSEQAIRKL
jgi:hypothetical protein